MYRTFRMTFGLTTERRSFNVFYTFDHKTKNVITN